MFKQFLLLISVVTTLAFPDIRAGSIFPSDLTGGVFLHDKMGWGSCPDVKPEKDFDLTKIYGKWYTVADYGEPAKEGERCRSMEIRSGDEENLSTPCRANVTFKYINTTTGEIGEDPSAFIFVSSENDRYSYTMKFSGGSSYNWYPIATDYDYYLAAHRCEEFSGTLPGTFPFPVQFYLQHNYILHRSPDGIDDKDYDNIQKFYNKLGISTIPFQKIDIDCTTKP